MQRDRPTLRLLVAGDPALVARVHRTVLRFVGDRRCAITLVDSAAGAIAELEADSGFDLVVVGDQGGESSHPGDLGAISRAAQAATVIALTTDERELERWCARFARDDGDASVAPAEGDSVDQPGPSPAEALRPLFLRNRELDVARIREALARQDFSELATIGHKMHGNGAAYGFAEVSALGAELENAATAHDERGVAGALSWLVTWLEHLGAADAARPGISLVRMRAAVEPNAPPKREPSSGR